MKTILLTGNSKGVGLNLTKILLENTEYKIVGVSRSFTKEVETLIGQYGERLVQVQYDLSNSEGIKDLYLKNLKQHGPFYAYVNNAAMAYDDIVSNLNIDRLDNMYKVNVYTPMMLTKYMIRDMLLSKTEGSIVHVSSISAHTGYKGLAMYASTKGALEAFSKNVAREWGAVGIRSNCVCPGFMDTEMSSTLSDDQKNRIFLRNSMKREVDVSSVSHTIKFLVSSEAKSITGQVYNVDCGTI